MSTPGHAGDERPTSVGDRPSKRSLLAALVLVVAGATAVNLLTPARSAPTGRGATEALPSPQLVGVLSLEEALRARRSIRSFSTQLLTRTEIGQLLWAAQGVTDAAGHRTAPSAGGLYPLELDVVTPDGVARYAPAEHRLTWRTTTDIRPALRAAAVDQAVVGEAPLIVVVSGVVERTAMRYGIERAKRYVALEAGHAAQNVLLQAVSLGLGAVPIGAFDDVAVRRILSLADDQDPLYLIPVGRPR